MGTISSSLLSMRYTPRGFIFESKGAMCFAEDAAIMKCCLGALNSSPAMRFLSILCPTLDFHEGPVGRVPVMDAIDASTQQVICNTVDNCISTSKDDWDSFETSWDFNHSPLV